MAIDNDEALKRDVDEAMEAIREEVGKYRVRDLDVVTLDHEEIHNLALYIMDWGFVLANRMTRRMCEEKERGKEEGR